MLALTADSLVKVCVRDTGEREEGGRERKSERRRKSWREVSAEYDPFTFTVHRRLWLLGVTGRQTGAFSDRPESGLCVHYMALSKGLSP